jgi:hypothetical protein
MKKYRVFEGNEILLETNDYRRAKLCQKEAHRKDPFKYHEIHPRQGLTGTTQLEPGDDPDTGRTKWCHERLTQEESNNGTHPKCLQCNELAENCFIHCPWQYFLECRSMYRRAVK